MVETLTTAFTSIASDCTSAIQAVLPIALTVAGAIVVVKLGMKVFHTVTKA